MERVKLIWDFRGPDAKKIAEHHIIHLNEFSAKESIIFENTGLIKLSDFMYSASVEINKIDLDKVKNALKPHRGQRVE